MQDDTANSSVATEVVAEDISTLSPAERTSWRLTGEFPAEKKSDSATDQNKEKPADQDAKKTPSDQKAQTVSETATNTQDEEPKPTSKAGKRIAQLVAERNEWKRQAEEAKAVKKEPEAKPASEKTEKLRAEPLPDDKKEDGSPKYKTYEEYNADRIEWGVEKALAKRDQQATKVAKDAEVEKQNKVLEDSWRSRVETAKTKHKDFEAVALNKDLPVKAGTVVDAFILDSDFGTDILYHLGQHPDELEKINAMPPWKQARAMMRIETTFETSAATKLPEKTAEKSEEPEVIQSKAPKPIREVGGRGGSPPDEEAAAVEHNDFRAFRSAANGREINLRKGR